MLSRALRLDVRWDRLDDFRRRTIERLYEWHDADISRSEAWLRAHFRELSEQRDRSAGLESGNLELAFWRKFSREAARARIIWALERYEAAFDALADEDIDATLDPAARRRRIWSRYAAL